MRMTHPLVRLALLAIATLGVSACTDATGPALFELERPEIEASGIHPSIVVGKTSGAVTQVEVHLRRVQTDARIGSFQGEIGFRSDLGAVVGAVLPEGVTGSWNEVAPGRLRFAGAALGPVADGAILSLAIEGSRVPKVSDFTLKIEEITAPDQYSNLTSLLVEKLAR